MNELSCRQAIEQLWAFIDSELPLEQNELVREHLAACAECMPCHDFQKAFCNLLRTHAQAPVPPALRRRVFTALLEEERTRGCT